MKKIDMDAVDYLNHVLIVGSGSNVFHQVRVTNA